MNSSRIVLNIVFWIVFSFAFDAVSGVLFPDLSMEATLILWFTSLCTGTFIFNAAWYWFTIRQR
ncbi:hypothetical protein [Methanoregula sp.]|uniref:hypothetical protein n=1 Tax=Methanoregula sp. TaxID=2052170 RepID=UPI003C7632D4